MHNYNRRCAIIARRALAMGHVALALKLYKLAGNDHGLRFD